MSLKKRVVEVKSEVSPAKVHAVVTIDFDEAMLTQEEMDRSAKIVADGMMGLCSKVPYIENHLCALKVTVRRRDG